MLCVAYHIKYELFDICNSCSKFSKYLICIVYIYIKNMKLCQHFCSNQRFDFGVPLEDVFPHKDIHPRLKFIFEKGYETILNNNSSIEDILSSSQESLDARLHSKDILINEVNYQKLHIHAPGTYLWLIRHFLGLLPIPLMPQYSNKMTFCWEKLSQECLDFLKSGGIYEDSYILNYIIVDGLSLLPAEHLILLNYLMVFLRQIASKTTNNHDRKRNIVSISKYFCGSIFIRPYRPGQKEKEMQPLLIYLLLKWHEIQSISESAEIIDYGSQKISDNFVCKENLYSLNSNFNYKCNVESQIYAQKCYIKDNGTQTDTIRIFNRSNQTSFQYKESIAPGIEVKETSSQTETIDVINRSSQTAAQILANGLADNEYEHINFKDALPLANSTTYLSEGQITGSIQSPNLEEISFVTAPDVTAKYYSICNNDGSIDNDSKTEVSNIFHDAEVRARPESQLLDQTPVSFLSALDKGMNWSSIVGETSKTVKKVDQYIYDDYDTFAKEDFNQLFEAKNPSLVQEEHKSSKLGWKNNIFKNICQNYNNNLEDENFYFRFEDVDDILINNEENTNESPNDDSSPTGKSLFNSNEKLYRRYKEKNNIYKETKSKLNFGLKRFKIKMSFFRRLTPKNTQGGKSVMEGYFNNPKYEKIKNDKANTI